MGKKCLLFIVCVFCLALQVFGQNKEDVTMNLLLNSDFDFHSFVNHRNGKANSYQSHNVAFWNTDAWKSVSVTRESHVAAKIRPKFTTRNLVRIAPGKKFWQFFTLPEAGLSHGDNISLKVFGYQSELSALTAKIKLMKLDSEDGEWRPRDFGMSDKRTFPKLSRGELVVAKEYNASRQKKGRVELKIEKAEILGKFTDGQKSHSKDINTIGIVVEFENTSKSGEVWVWSPSLVRGDKAIETRLNYRTMEPYYRNIPRTIQKLWKGEPIHIVLMGSSIDRGSANPPLYVYNEDSKSTDFKKPICDAYNGKFDTKVVGRPELNNYCGDARHYFSYAARLKMELMRKFDMPVDKILLNYMACDGSCVGEAHSGLADYCSLSIPPDINANGHKPGKTWKQLYPPIFKRPEGTRPDLVIFGSGANEKTDTPEEVAVFEGTIRWIQRHYPETEFLFCQFQNKGGYTANQGDLQALALKYQIPFLDFGKIGDDLTRWCNRYTFVPRDGHPQAAAHYVWYKQIEKAFECWDPIMPGQAQLQLPERIHRNTYGWEGEMLKFDAKSPRLRRSKFIFEDTAINCWGDTAKGVKPIPYVDGKKQASRKSFPKRDVRNSMFRFGNCSLGDRHVLEIAGKGAKLTAVDAKVCPDRRFFGIENPRWALNGAKPVKFASKWGAPYGEKMVTLEPGACLTLDVVCTDISVAYFDTAKGGTLKVFIDGDDKLSHPTNKPFVDIEKQKHFMENRKGILNLGFGLHRIKLVAEKAPLKLLGVFTYDSRSNRKFERRLVGIATPDETVEFSLPFKTRPLVICTGGLKVETEDVSTKKVTFSGSSEGTYEIVGE